MLRRRKRKGSGLRGRDGKIRASYNKGHLRMGGKTVSRKVATTKQGKLRKGCRFVKGGGAVCTHAALRRMRRKK